MTDQLYIKTKSANGRVSYVPHVAPDPRRVEIEQSQAVALLSTITLSMLMSVEDQYPPHSRLAREINNVGKAVAALAKLNNAPLDADLVDVGVAAWNAAIRVIQEGLQA